MGDDEPISLSDLPQIIPPVYACAVNEPIELVSGKAELQFADHVAAGSAVVSLRWLPRPRIVFEVNDASGLHPVELTEELKLTISPKLVGVDATITAQSYTMGAGFSQCRGVVTSKAVVGTGDALSSLVFHVVNFPTYRGSIVVHSGDHASAARATLSADGWVITIDELPGGTEREERLRLGGYAITHVAKIARVHGDPFTSAAGMELVYVVREYLSFVAGRRVGTVLPVGFGSDGSRTWEVIDPTHLGAASWRTLRSWFYTHERDSLGAAFGGFYRRWQDEAWRESLKLAIHWYIECNGSAGAVEGSVILEQAAFELLAWMVLVEEYGILSRGGFESLPAADKIRLLVSHCGIPLAIPQELAAMTVRAKELNWIDGPQGIVEIRNALVHPNPEKRAKLTKAGSTAISEAWTLGLWYLELVLLRLFGYQNEYVCRLVSGTFMAMAVRPVPWASAASDAPAPTGG